MKENRNSFKGSIGFVLAAAGSAVGLGNIWRFPYLAAKDGGGLFLVLYILLALTFGFTLLTSEIAIGRKTKQSPLTAYGKLKKGWGFLGVIACIVPIMIMPYYCVIGGWVVKYFLAFIGGKGVETASDGYFTNYITDTISPIVMLVIFLGVVAFIVYRGVNKGIEQSSKIIMPILILFVVGIAIFSLTMSSTDADGITRTGLDGFKVYVIPDFSGMTIGKFFNILFDALGQLFYSLSVAMGIMITYGSYVKDEANIGKSINQIEIFDTLVAFFAGIMIIPAVYAFSGMEGLEASGPGLMFVSLPKVFMHMGKFGNLIGCLFFAMVLFAAITSAVSILEAIVSSLMDRFHFSRKKAVFIETAIALVGGIVVNLGYNLLYFEAKLPTSSNAQILDILDYVSNSCLMPVVAIGTCILIGWVIKPKTVLDEVEKNGQRCRRRGLYIIMIKFIAPVLLGVLLLRSFGVF